ncbi:histidinol phosphate phosphatase H [Whalleya microplaca]|nr:histidinol phosphate phosphatase H [Whalleya microplaca]
MAFTMHSHSGQFCPGHAKDQLEDIVKHAISLGYTTMGLTEHMPRTHLEDLYPEELDNPEATLAELIPRHAAYMQEAQRLQKAYAGQIDLLIGFEGEWMRSAYGPLVRTLAEHPSVDYFIGSLHHVCGVPIDYDDAWYARAREAANNLHDGSGVNGSGDGGAGGESGGDGEERMWARYYDEQHEMLTTLRPRVVGHFDLVRLLSADPARDVRGCWPGVWERIVRNLRAVAEYGGWLECNSSALRKGLAEPYPCRAIAEEWLKMGGKFTLSDDSHGIAQLGTNYGRALDYLTSLGVQSVWTLQRDEAEKLVDKEVPIEDIRAVVSKW